MNDFIDNWNLNKTESPDKWTKKYMKMAKALADDNEACYSRKIGVVLIGVDNTPIGFGYNGSITGSPHNDEAVYLAHLWKNLLNEDQKKYLKDKFGLKPKEPHNQFYYSKNKNFIIHTQDPELKAFVDKFEGCKTCPRRLLDIPSRVGLELCNCAHAERNALANANKSGVSTKGAKAYCWCNIPCHECSVQLIQAGISDVYCLYKDQPAYSPSSRGLFATAGVKLHLINEQDILS